MLYNKIIHKYIYNNNTATHQLLNLNQEANIIYTWQSCGVGEMPILIKPRGHYPRLWSPD